MAPPRTVDALARQQAGWFAATRRTGHLDASDVLLARFTGLYATLRETAEWDERDSDLRAAATAAGLVLVGEGYALPGGDQPPPADYGHLTASEEVMRRGALSASAWAFTLLTGGELTAAPSNALDAVSGYIWARESAFAWAWWCCRLENGDSGPSVSARGLAAWVAGTRPDRRRSWLPADVLIAQHEWARPRRQPRVDPRHLQAAAHAVGLRLTKDESL